MDAENDSGELLIAKRHEDARAYCRRHVIDRVGKCAIERDGQGNIAEDGHVVRVQGLAIPAYEFRAFSRLKFQELD